MEKLQKPIRESDKLKKFATAAILAVATASKANAGLEIEKSSHQKAKEKIMQQDTGRKFESIAKNNQQRDYLLNIKSEYYKVALKAANERRLKRLMSYKFTLADEEARLVKEQNTGNKDNVEIFSAIIKDLKKYIELDSKEFTLADIEGSLTDVATPEEAKDAFEKIDKQREWFANIVNSPEYRQIALTKEKLSQAEVLRRQVDSTKDTIKLNEEPAYDPTAYHITDSIELGNYDEGKITTRFGKTHGNIGVEQYQDYPNAVHELEHLVTDGNNHLSKKAIELYMKAYKKFNGPNDAYFSSPTELDARRRVFQYELEQNGVWKYGEEFTREHLEKALQLAKDGRLSLDSRAFLDLLKHDLIPVIMNTIAEDKINASQTETKQRKT